MDHKNYESSVDPSFSNKDHYLKQLNKLSHNISKPNIKKATFDASQNHTISKHAQPESQPQAHVYNISKNDFRDMVQKLTGSPSHHQQPKPVSTSRLHRLRPPPLPQIIGHRPPPYASVPPPSPLPPFPSVHAESPVSAYMSFLQNSMGSSSESEFVMASSPVHFGCFNSLGFPLVPVSPTVPVTSPGWRDL
ncbi:VQ motif-containing protein 9-like [Abrus precatorius]|uniref:VQ motif-containing protein 9-like n=1 Tax=Abrus precatorius TaxID=3816 RepID=A0A8B8MI46_ABRPR|nr:VQ motif-containing protein 9-like [Abrus precatorius]